MDIVEAGRYVIVTVFSVDGSFIHLVELLFNDRDDEDDYEIRFLKRSKQIKDGFVLPYVYDLATAKKSDLV